MGSRRVKLQVNLQLSSSQLRHMKIVGEHAFGPDGLKEWKLQKKVVDKLMWMGVVGLNQANPPHPPYYYLTDFGLNLLAASE